MKRRYLAYFIVLLMSTFIAVTECQSQPVQVSYSYGKTPEIAIEIIYVIGVNRAGNTGAIVRQFENSLAGEGNGPEK